MFSDVEVIDLGDERGRALFSKRGWVEGEVIFKELPLMVVHEENADENGELPGWAPAFQFLWEDEDVRQEVLRLYCPPLESLEYLPKVRDILEDAIAWSKEEEADYDWDSVDKEELVKVMVTWVFNAFDFGDGAGSVYFSPVLTSSAFKLATKLNHSCVPNATWYREGDDFVLRALADIGNGEEITLSYLGLKNKFMSTEMRRNILRTSKRFTCNCLRCVKEDTARGFLCPSCNRQGVVFLMNSGESSPCTICGRVIGAGEVEGLLITEKELGERVQALNRNQWQVSSFEVLRDLKRSLRSSQIAPQHWISAELNDMLHHWHVMQGNPAKASSQMRKQIRFLENVFPRPNLRTASCYAALADSLCSILDPVTFQSPIHRLTHGALKAECALDNTQQQGLREEIAGLYARAVQMLELVEGPGGVLYQDVKRKQKARLSLFKNT